ncbi:hypothetical protein EV363DRAFT_1583016 [Boletus edulis]|nr:hypothetical protein EV363DRAFT_1583016 [Boletus edulis]
MFGLVQGLLAFWMAQVRASGFVSTRFESRRTSLVAPFVFLRLPTFLTPSPSFSRFQTPSTSPITSCSPTWFLSRRSAFVSTSRSSLEHYHSLWTYPGTAISSPGLPSHPELYRFFFLPLPFSSQLDVHDKSISCPYLSNLPGGFLGEYSSISFSERSRSRSEHIPARSHVLDAPVTSASP